MPPEFIDDIKNKQSYLSSVGHNLFHPPSSVIIISLGTSSGLSQITELSRDQTGSTLFNGFGAPMH